MIKMYNCQFELISTGVSRGGRQVTNEELASVPRAKFNALGEQQGDLLVTSAEDMYGRLGVKSRPRVAKGQNHTTLFNAAFDDALKNAKEYGVGDVRGNVTALFASSTHDSSRLPKFLDEVAEHVGLNQDAKRSHVSNACAGFGSCVKYASDHVERTTHEGYVVVGASEFLSELFCEDNFDGVMFGDMSAVSIWRAKPGRIAAERRGLIGTVHSYTQDNDHILWNEDGFVYMNGREVFKIAPRAMVATCKKSLEQDGLTAQEIDKFIFHPGSKHITRAIATTFRNRLYGSEPLEGMLPNDLEDTGNVGSASTPNTLHRQIVNGEVGRNSKVYVGALGMGFYESGFMINGFPTLAEVS